MTKVYFPRMLIPLSGFFGIGWFLHRQRHSGRDDDLVSGAVVCFTTLGSDYPSGNYFAGWNRDAICGSHVCFRDIRFALPFLVQFWMFATPVIYPASRVPARWRWLLVFNPMAGLVTYFARHCSARRWNGTSAISTLAAALLLIYSVYFFRRAERTFADVIGFVRVQQ